MALNRKFKFFLSAAAALVAIIAVKHFTAPQDNAQNSEAQAAQDNAKPIAGVKLAPIQFLQRNIKETPASLDPGKMSDSNSIKVNRSLFDPLIRQNPAGDYVGVAAESWNVAEDGLTWTFNLRKNATWSDGKPVTAHDFVYAWQRLTDPTNGSVYTDYLATANVVNANEVTKGQLDKTALGIKAVDDYTFEVKLTQPTPWFAQLVSLGVLSPVRQDLIEKYGDQWTRPEYIATNGPYILSENVVNDHLRFRKVPTYWDSENVHITDSTYIYVTDINMVYNKYLANELLTADIPPHLFNKVLQERPDEVKEYLDPLTWFVDFNTEKVSDPKVRRALKLLINNRFLTDNILKAGKATSIYSPTFLQDGQFATEEAYFNNDYHANVAEGIKLLQEAGYSSQHPFEFEFVSVKEQLINQVLVAFQGWFAQNSQGLVKFTPRVVESRIYQDMVQNKDFTIRLGYRRADYDQASSFYNALLCGNSQNTSNWCNAEYDQLITEANKTVDATKRAQLYAQANLLIQQETPLIPLYVKGAYLLQSPALGGLSLKVKRRFLRDYYIIADKKVAPTE